MNQMRPGDPIMDRIKWAAYGVAAGLMLGIVLGWVFHGVVGLIVRIFIILVILAPFIAAFLFWPDPRPQREGANSCVSGEGERARGADSTKDHRVEVAPPGCESREGTISPGNFRPSQHEHVAAARKGIGCRDA